MRSMTSRPSFRPLFRPAAGAVALLAALALPASAATTVWFGGSDHRYRGNFGIGPSDDLVIEASGAWLESSGIGLTSLLSVQGTVTAFGNFNLDGANASNAGLWNLAGNVSVDGACCNPPSGIFNNLGTLRKTAGSGSATFGGPGAFLQFENSGVIEAQQGYFTFFNAPIFHAGTSFTGAGATQVLGNGRFEGAFSSTNLQLNRGNQLGVDAVINGRVQFTGGQLQGQWEVASGQRLEVFRGGQADEVTFAGTLVNRGDVVLTESTIVVGLVGVGNGLVNHGTLDVQDGGFTVLGNTPGILINNGLLLKSGGTGTFDLRSFPIPIDLSNNGTLDVRSGSFILPDNFVNKGRMKGTGGYIVNGTLSNAGHVAPGNSPGTMAISGSFAQGAGGVLDIELGGAAGSDLLRVSGNATLGGTLALQCWAACSYAVGEQIVVLDAEGSVSGSFDAITLNGFAAGAFNTGYDAATGRVLLTVTEATVAAVPEPGGYALWMAGLGVLGWMARRQRRV